MRRFVLDPNRPGMKSLALPGLCLDDQLMHSSGAFIIYISPCVE